MIIILKPGCSSAEEQEIINEVETLGYKPHIVRGVEHVVIGAVGDERSHHTLETLNNFPQVQEVMRVQKRHKLVNRQCHPEGTLVQVGEHRIGSAPIHVMAGPCSVEGEKQLMETAIAVKEAGATILRGGAFKPRTSPYEFQGLGEDGLKLLARAREETGMPVITELLSENHASMVAEYADILQIGTRNAQNFQLLIAAAKTGRPVLLKRGLSMKFEEWLLAGEYVLANGNANLMFCERGIRTFETYTRNTLDLAAIPVMKSETHLPVVIDPSQGCGRAQLVKAACRGSIAMGADALLIEVHPNPAEAWSDGAQQLSIADFRELMQELKPIAAAVGRSIATL